MAAVSFKSFACQNWIITPAALAVNEPKPSSISDQKWLLVLSGIGILDLQGNNAHDWRREILFIFPDVNAPLEFAINKYSIPRPVGLKTAPAINLEQWLPFAAINSIFDRDTAAVDAGFAVDAWRANQFLSTSDAGGKPVTNIFTGIDVDVAVRNNKATLHRVSYHITLLGKIVFLVQT